MSMHNPAFDAYLDVREMIVVDEHLRQEHKQHKAMSASAHSALMPSPVAELPRNSAPASSSAVRVQRTLQSLANVDVGCVLRI